jgi:hypothetical protein
VVTIATNPGGFTNFINVFLGPISRNLYFTSAGDSIALEVDQAGVLGATYNGSGSVGILVNAAEDTVYVSQIGTNEVDVYSIAGGSPTILFAINNPKCMAFGPPALNGDILIYDEDTIQILRFTITGVFVSNYVTGNVPNIFDCNMVFDSSGNLYFGNSKSSDIRVAPLTLSGGASFTVIASGLNANVGLVLIESQGLLYVSSFTNNTISTVPMAGGAATFYANVPDSPSGLTVDLLTNVIFGVTSDGVVYKVLPCVNDVCDVCNGSGITCLDCNGVPNGASVYDACDVCCSCDVGDCHAPVQCTLQQEAQPCCSASCAGCVCRNI